MKDNIKNSKQNKQGWKENYNKVPILDYFALVNDTGKLPARLWQIR